MQLSENSKHQARPFVLSPASTHTKTVHDLNGDDFVACFTEPLHSGRLFHLEDFHFPSWTEWVLSSTREMKRNSLCIFSRASSACKR
jgi:hypothetical protein